MGQNDQKAPAIVIPWRRPDTLDKQEENVRAIERFILASDVWEVVGGDLHPVSPPDSLTVDTSAGHLPGGTINLTASDAVAASQINITGNTFITSTEQVEINVSGSGKTLFIDTNLGAAIVVAAEGQVTIQSIDGTSDVVIEAAGTGHVVMNNLPIVNPGGSGRVWNNGGVLNIT